MLAWFLRLILPADEVLDPEDPVKAEEAQMVEEMYFRGMDGLFTLIKGEDLPEAIAAEYEDAARGQDLAIDGDNNYWVLDTEGIREIIVIALAAGDEETALMTVVANTDWVRDHEDEDDPFV